MAIFAFVMWVAGSLVPETCELSLLSFSALHRDISNFQSIAVAVQCADVFHLQTLRYYYGNEQPS